MVVFACNNCGESLKKQVVSTHAYRCRRDISVSCMDCQKDFTAQTYNAHTSCISEEQKYSAKGFVAKEKKGAKKQEGWIAMVRSITESKHNLPKGVKSVFDMIQRNDNIPRKEKGFMNFFANSCRFIGKNDVQAAWALIEEEVKKEKEREAKNQKSNVPAGVPSENGTTAAATNGHPQKRKLEEDVSDEQNKKKKQKANKLQENGDIDSSQTTKSKKEKQDASENGPEEEEPQPATKQKKQKTKKRKESGNEDDGTTALLEHGTNGNANTEQQEQNGTEERFDWLGVIRNTLMSKSNQMKLSKLKTKVMKRYQQLTGTECDGKFEKKFHKKMAKAGCVVENDTVRLVEA
uniref:Uncharacterized protein n=1 Tax=Anopheles epiroticus TaxID=199890 RepID=A0A182PPH0_9DIPT